MQETVEHLLVQLRANEADKFAAHLYHARRDYRRVSERPGKGDKPLERSVLSSYQIAQSLGFKGDYHALGALAADSRVRGNFPSLTKTREYSNDSYQKRH